MQNSETISEPVGRPSIGQRYGVLFVHGIGEQKRGDTLIDFAEPVIHWLRDAAKIRRRIRESNEDSKQRSGDTIEESPAVLIDSVYLSPTDDGVPAHFEMLTNDHQGGNDCWIVAESWWANRFRRPSFGSLARWLLGIGAWMIFSHYGKLIRTWRGRLRYVVALRYIPESICVAIVAQLLVLILAVFAVMPFIRFRDYLSAVLLKLTGTLGDCYLYTHSPVQKAAAVGRVRDDLSWILKRCEKAVVVAHSQGAAVAHEVVASQASPKLRGFVTLGSGLGKLTEVSLLDERDGIMLRRYAQYGLPLLPVMLFLPRVSSYFYADSPWFMLGLPFALVYVCLPPLMLVAVFYYSFVGWDRYRKKLKQLRLSNANCKWTDIYSSRDPVSNGPLGTDDELAVLGIDSVRVVNQNSVLRDHTMYWKNMDEFIPTVLKSIDNVLESRLVILDDQALERGAIKRQQRIWLRLGATLTLVATIGLAAVKDWRQVRQAITDMGSHVPVFGNLLDVVGAFVANMGRFWGGSQSDVRNLGAVVVAGAIFATVFLICKRVLAAAAAIEDNEFALRELFVDKVAGAGRRRVLEHYGLTLLILASSGYLGLAIFFSGSTFGAIHWFAYIFRWIFSFWGLCLVWMLGYHGWKNLRSRCKSELGDAPPPRK